MAPPGVVVILDPVRNRLPRVGEAKERGFVRKLPHPAIEGFEVSVLRRFAGAM